MNYQAPDVRYNAPPADQTDLDAIQSLIEDCMKSTSLTLEALTRARGVDLAPNEAPVPTPSGRIGRIQEVLRSLRDMTSHIAEQTNRLA